MRFKDYVKLLKYAAIMSLIVVIILWFTWDEFENNPDIHGFALWLFLMVPCLPFAYFLTKSKTKCPACKKPFKISQTGQEDISHYVKYKNEHRNGIQQDVPYNVREYFQYLQCDHCSHEYKERRTDESRS